MTLWVMVLMSFATFGDVRDDPSGRSFAVPEVTISHYPFQTKEACESEAKKRTLENTNIKAGCSPIVISK